jgi:inhibitor of cysteine peptidase
MRVFLSALLAVAAFSSLVSAANLSLTEFDQDRSCILHRGDTLLISLLSNRTTGYGWDYLFSKIGPLRQEGEMVYQQAKSGEGMVGTGGTEIWKFMAVKKGKTSLCFSYLRPWERSIAPVKTNTWNITVE